MIDLILEHPDAVHAVRRAAAGAGRGRPAGAARAAGALAAAPGRAAIAGRARGAARPLRRHAARGVGPQPPGGLPGRPAGARRVPRERGPADRGAARPPGRGRPVPEGPARQLRAPAREPDRPERDQAREPAGDRGGAAAGHAGRQRRAAGADAPGGGRHPPVDPGKAPGRLLQAGERAPRAGLRRAGRDAHPGLRRGRPQEGADQRQDPRHLGRDPAAPRSWTRS